jgi:hypothetical protein
VGLLKEFVLNNNLFGLLDGKRAGIRKSWCSNRKRKQLKAGLNG